MCILLLEIRLIRFNSTEVFEEDTGKGLLANFFFFFQGSNPRLLVKRSRHPPSLLTPPFFNFF